MKTIAELLPEIPLFEGLPTEHLELLAGCGHNVVAEPGEYLFREGKTANDFFALRHGAIGIEISVPAREPIVVQTLHPGDVAGWSWIFPAQPWSFSGRAVERTRAVSFDGACLRGKCEDDHELGYELMRRVAIVMAERLRFTRMQLLDVYGRGAAA